MNKLDEINNKIIANTNAQIENLENWVKNLKDQNAILRELVATLESQLLILNERD